MFVVIEGHLSGTKRVVLCNARNETKRGMPGQPKLTRQARLLWGKQGKPKGTRIRRRQASFLQWVTFNEEKTHQHKEVFTMPQVDVDMMEKELKLCTCQQKLDTKLKKSGIKNESMYKIHQLF